MILYPTPFLCIFIYVSIPCTVFICMNLYPTLYIYIYMILYPTPFLYACCYIIIFSYRVGLTHLEIININAYIGLEPNSM